MADHLQALARIRKDWPDDGVRFEGPREVDDAIVDRRRNGIADATLAEGAQGVTSRGAASNLDGFAAWFRYA
jgi:hypothetical protein